MRIWFNRGFSLAPIAALMRAADPALEVFVSVGAHAAQHAGPTATWIDGGADDATSIDDYIDWVRAMIAAHRIDLFIPTRHRPAIARTDLPCAVHLPATLPVLDLLDDKFAFAEAMIGEPWHLPTWLATDADTLATILADWPSDGPAACVKPRRGVNGLGFWQLSDVSPLAHLNDPDRRRMRADQYLAALRAQEQDGPIPALVVMPYLPGPEISFDILADRGALLKYAARTKLPNNHQQIVTLHELEPAVAALVARFGLHGLVNCQFRRAADGSWKLLEINARPAGGVVYADQVGCHLVSDWSGLLTGRLTPASIDRRTINTEVAFASIARAVAT